MGRVLLLREGAATVFFFDLLRTPDDLATRVRDGFFAGSREGIDRAPLAGDEPDAAFPLELLQVGANVAVRGTTEFLINVGIETQHDLPAAKGAAGLENGENLLFPRVAVGNVSAEPVCSIVNEGAVARADEFEVGEGSEAVEGSTVGSEIVHGGGPETEDGVARKEDPVVFEVVANGVRGMAGCRENLNGKATAEIDRAAILQVLNASGGEAVAEEVDTAMWDENLSAERLTEIFEVAAVVKVVVGNAGEGDLRSLNSGKIAADHPLEFVNGFPRVNSENLVLTDEVDVGGTRPHRVALGDCDDTDVR